MGGRCLCVLEVDHVAGAAAGGVDSRAGGFGNGGMGLDEVVI